MKFRINIANWQGYVADQSLETPHNDRQLNAWVASSSAAITIGVVACTSGSVPQAYALGITAGTIGTNGYFAHNSGTAPFRLYANNARGYTIEALVKAQIAGSSAGQMIYWQDDVWKEGLCFGTGLIKLFHVAGSYTMNTITNFHKYRITVKGNVCKVYVDDVLRITGTLTSSGARGSEYIAFGSLFATVSHGGQAEWAYVRYLTEGAYAPNDPVNDGWVYDKFDIQDRRRVSELQVIRSDNVIVPEGKMQAARLRISGTVAGSCWPSFRDTVGRLKKLLKAGTQKIWLDDERFIEGLHSGFSLNPITKNFGEFDVDFTCRYPYWRENWASYISTVPVDNATYYIYNNGDIEVPCKLILTGKASGSIATDIEIDNVSLDLAGKFTGDLKQTSEVVIDKGFDIYSDYQFKIDSASAFGSWEGDLFTLKPGKNAFVYKGTAAGTIEFYWREAFL